MAVAAIAPRRQLGEPDIADTFHPLDIAIDRCKGCELCVAACPKDVLALDLAVVNRLGHHPIRLTDAARCTSCALCARVCPDAVFTVYARPRDP
jgi:2-oxoglutarate ferredoxin oxidoreductase subunit delta